jgi:hypothetical protein
MLYSQNQDGRWRPTDKALLATLLNILQQFQNAYIIIDALDECTEQDKLLNLFEEIIEWKLSTLHILATSCREREIEGCLSGIVSNQIDIQSTLVAQDIRIHVHESLQKDQKLQKWPEKMRVEIEDALMEGAHGM